MSFTGGAHPDWMAFHLFYHGDRGLATREMVRPLVDRLAEEGLVDRFFLIRYPLGGPHLRLRFRPAGDDGNRRDPALRNRLKAEVEQAAERLFADHPSEEDADLEAIRRDNEIIVSKDPSESRLEIYPNHSCIEFDFEPEVERYGGPELLRASLDFFAVSTRRALDFALTHGERPRSKQLPAMFCLLARQAWGFARDTDELVDLLAYPMDVLRSEPDHPLVERGDRVFEAQSEVFCKLLSGELEALVGAEPAIGEGAIDEGSTSEPDSGRLLAEGARWLSEAIAGADPARRRVIGSSQMHMTANRLGLKNPEELYLSRLMQRAAEHLARTEPELWSHCTSALGQPLPSLSGADAGPDTGAEKLAALARPPIPTLSPA